ncbi:transcription factor-like 5 protein [Brachionichthys hirsutus]|uniref:transcription factor-like 5 protein n=1 Tax=Brachionichthys hirsutus TaxID=412623 RepID=UPI003604F971
MSSFPTPGKTIHLSFSPPCDSTGGVPSQSGCLIYNHGQMSSSEFSVTGISEVEYTHLQQLVPVHVEAYSGSPEEPGDKSHPAFETIKDAISLLAATEAADLSSLAHEHSVATAGERTPPSHGEVPGYVLARVNNADSPRGSQTSSHAASLMQARSSVRVCLEKRFNSMPDETPTRQDVQSVVPDNLLSMLQPSAETQETVARPQMQQLTEAEAVNPFDISKSCVGFIFNPVTNMYEECQGLIRSFSFDQSETVSRRAHYVGGTNSTERQQLVKTGNDAATSAASSWNTSSTRRSQSSKAAKTAPDSTGISGRDARKKRCSHISHSQRREIHNFRERNRRKKIRSCCDELNMLVPFCESDSDKATTLQWTTAFLRYINATYGNIFREEFQKSFANEKGTFLNSSSSSVQSRIHQDLNETLTSTLAFEQ